MPISLNRAAKATVLSFLALVAALGYVTQASYLLGSQQASVWRGFTVIPALAITLLIGAWLPARRLGVVLTAVVTALAAVGFGDPDLKSLLSYFAANVLTDLTVNITWKLCANNFRDAVRGQSVQNVLSLLATGIAGALATRLSPFGVRPYAALALFTALTAAVVGLSGRARSSAGQEVPEPSSPSVDHPARLWTIGVSALFAPVLALRATAEIPSFDIVARARLGEAFMLVEPGMGIMAALLFAVQPSLYHRLVMFFRGEGRVIVTMASIASAAYILTGVSARAFLSPCVYVAWGVAGAALELVERTCDNVIHQYTLKKKREVFAAMFVPNISRIFYPVVLAPLAWFRADGAEALMLQGVFLIAFLVVILVAAKPIGRQLLKVAGPHRE